MGLRPRPPRNGTRSLRVWSVLAFQLIVCMDAALHAHATRTTANAMMKGTASVSTGLASNNSLPVQVGASNDPQYAEPLYAGYLHVEPGSDSAIYYAYYEAQQTSEDVGEAPIVLWLQGGPGCASTFGGFYELGPFMVTEDLRLSPNQGAWNRIFGLLLMDQPVGTGYSVAHNSSSIPTDEMGMATHLYTALQAFFAAHSGLRHRPFFITGESYAGKYVPSIAHFILQAEHQATAQQHRDSDVAQGRRGAAGSSAAGSSGGGAARVRLEQRRQLPPDTPKPIFNLRGIAIGNGLTDPRAQTQTLSSAAYFHGLLTPALRDEALGRALRVVGLIDDEKWAEAHDEREALRSFIINVTALATMYDTRRTTEYDPTKAVDRYLNTPQVKEAMRARPTVQYQSCSKVVGAAMSADVMRSVKYLVPDILANMHVLLYQGQFDILDGVSSALSWLDTLGWPQQEQFRSVEGEVWWTRQEQQQQQQAGAAGGNAAPPGQVAGGWRRSLGTLEQVVVYKAGHMVPHDQPRAAQQMLEEWVLKVLADDD